MGYLMTDQRRSLMHTLVRKNKELGFSTTAAIGEAIREIEGGEYLWWLHFVPSAEDVRLMRLRGVELGTAAITARHRNAHHVTHPNN